MPADSEGSRRDLKDRRVWVFDLDNTLYPAECDLFAQIDQSIQAVDMAISEMTSAATQLGAAKSRMALQLDFVSALQDSIDRGVSTLVDADMNEESTRLQALQVQLKQRADSKKEQTR